MTSRSRPLAPGERVLLVDRRRRTYLVRLEPGATFHSHLGTIPHDAILGQPEGCYVRTPGGHSFLVVRLTPAEYVLKMARQTNVLYPKDLALILAQTGIGPGALVVEAGLGSGGATLALLHAVGPGGRVVSYEAREEFQALAQRNLRGFFGHDPPNLEVHLGDIAEGIEAADADAVVLDLPEPWRVVSAAAKALRPGGFFVSYVPTILQVQQAVLALRADGRFALVQALENLVREWEVAERSVRPAHRMVGHTGFLVFARRCQPAGETSGEEASAAREAAPEEEQGG